MRLKLPKVILFLTPKLDLSSYLLSASTMLLSRKTLIISNSYGQT